MYRQPPTELKSTISTMKVILLFALFGVSFCQDSKCTVEPLSEPNDGNCLAQAVKELGTFYQAFVDMCCAAAAKGTMTDDDIRATAKQFVITLNCLGCQIGRYFGEEETFQTLIDKIGDKGTDIVVLVHQILGIFGLDQTKAELVCTLSKLIPADCSVKALTDIISGGILDLKDLFCKLKSGSAAAAAAKVTEIAKKAGCAVDKVVGTDKDQTLETFLGSLSKEVLQDRIEKVLDIAAKNELIAKIVCPLIDPTGNLLPGLGR